MDYRILNEKELNWWNRIAEDKTALLTTVFIFSRATQSPFWLPDIPV